MPQQKYGVLNHRILWGCATKNLALGQHKGADASYFNLTAMTMVYFAFEGYLNYLGELIAPEVWKEERQFFTRKPYEGTIGKYMFLMKITAQPAPSSSRRPFLTVRKLAELRDFVAHSRPEIGQRTARISKKTGFPTQYQHKLGKMVSRTKANHAIEDVESVLKGLHESAKRDYHIPGDEPFGHMWSWSTVGI